MAAAPIIEVNVEHPQPRHVQRAVEVLSSGGVIAYPTDTYARLADVKRRYDPRNLFHLNQNIRPATRD